MLEICLCGHSRQTGPRTTTTPLWVEGVCGGVTPACHGRHRHQRPPRYSLVTHSPVAGGGEFAWCRTAPGRGGAVLPASPGPSGGRPTPPSRPHHSKRGEARRRPGPRGGGRGPGRGAATAKSVGGGAPRWAHNAPLYHRRCPQAGEETRRQRQRRSRGWKERWPERGGDGKGRGRQPGARSRRAEEPAGVVGGEEGRAGRAGRGGAGRERRARQQEEGRRRRRRRPIGGATPRAAAASGDSHPPPPQPRQLSGGRWRAPEDGVDPRPPPSGPAQGGGDGCIQEVGGATGPRSLAARRLRSGRLWTNGRAGGRAGGGGGEGRGGRGSGGRGRRMAHHRPHERDKNSPSLFLLDASMAGPSHRRSRDARPIGGGRPPTQPPLDATTQPRRSNGAPCSCRAAVRVSYQEEAATDGLHHGQLQRCTGRKGERSSADAGAAGCCGRQRGRVRGRGGGVGEGRVRGGGR